MFTATNVKTITDMRQRAKSLLNAAAKSVEPVFIFANYKPKAVLLGLDEYQKLREVYEDYMDSLEALEFQKKDKNKINWLSEKQIME